MFWNIAFLVSNHSKNRGGMTGFLVAGGVRLGLFCGIELVVCSSWFVDWETLRFAWHFFVRDDIFGGVSICVLGLFLQISCWQGGCVGCGMGWVFSDSFRFF